MTKLHRYWLAGLLSLALACPTPVLADEPSDFVGFMDPTAPKYQTPECEAARQKAAKYDSNILGRALLGAALGLTLSIFGLPLAAQADHDEAQRQVDAVQELVRQCGNDAFIPYFKGLAEKGDDHAQAWLGQAYAAGVNGQPDWEQSAHWYRLAADQGDVAAEVNLGGMYLDGKGVPQDRDQAAALWQKAADDGSNEGKTNLGRLYVSEQKYEEAQKLFLSAAKHGHASAQFYLGLLYEQGLGVEKSDLFAYGWYSVAALGGEGRATARRDSVGARLTPGEINRVAPRVKTCVSSHYRTCSF